MEYTQFSNWALAWDGFIVIRTDRLLLLLVPKLLIVPDQSEMREKVVVSMIVSNVCKREIRRFFNPKWIWIDP